MRMQERKSKKFEEHFEIFQVILLNKKWVKKINEDEGEGSITSQIFLSMKRLESLQ